MEERPFRAPSQLNCEEKRPRKRVRTEGITTALNMIAFVACNAYNRCMQYTIRNVPSPLDAALRRSARDQGKSLNEVAMEALARGAGLSERWPQRDLSDIAGTWRKDAAFDRALAAQDAIDEELWR